jgi:uncharacterized protein
MFFLVLCVSPIWAASPFDGDWIGGFERPESHVFVHAHFVQSANETTGTIDVVDFGDRTRAIGKPLEKVTLDPSHAHFELADRAGRLSFEGRVKDRAMNGVVEDKGMKLPFRLDLMATIDPSRYTGTYQVGPEHFIRITPTSPPFSLFSLDSQSAQLRMLLARSEADFVCGPGLDVYPVQATIRFITNHLGQVTALQWKSRNSPALLGTRMKTQPEEAVSFTNGDVTLSGTLLLPPIRGLHPAVVLVNGSGPSVRSDLQLLADFFALNGMATLTYDKRGCGSSTGDWRKSGFNALAGDALAGLELLKNQRNINPHQIGLWGISQGGWLVPLAASRSADVAFVISVSGPGITPEAQGAYCVEHWMKAAGYSKADLREALTLYQLDSHCTRTDNGWDKLKAVRKAYQNKPWYNACPFLSADSPEAQKQWQLIWNYDPVPALRKVHCPVLAIFGDLDALVPPQKSADIWKKALTEAGNHDVVIRIFPHANHSIADPRTGLPVPGYLALEREWLSKHVAVGD